MFNFEFNYAPSYAYVREPPFNHIDSTSSGRISLASSLTIAISRFSPAGQQNKDKGA